MKVTPIKTCIVLLLTVLPAVVVAQNKDQEQLTITLSSPGKPFKLNMNLAGGSVNISTHEGKDLRISASAQPGTNDNTSRSKNQNVNINANSNLNLNSNSGADGTSVNKNTLLKAVENGNQVLVSQLNQNRVLHVDVSLPKNNTSLNLTLSGRGNVNIADVNGEIEVTSADGPIILKNISGSALVTTINGNITATFKNVNARAPMAFSTLIGEIDLSLPALAKASVTLHSDQAIVFSDFGLITTKTELKKNKNGSYQTKLAGSFSGNINGGGQEINITNMQGNIHLRKNK